MTHIINQTPVESQLLPFCMVARAFPAHDGLFLTESLAASSTKPCGSVAAIPQGEAVQLHQLSRLVDGVFFPRCPHHRCQL